jgi:hypothetical protein
MEAMPLLSGLDFARGLMRNGYRMVGNAGGYLLLERASRAVTVPIVDELDPALVRFLALAAGVLPPHLVAALQTPGDAPLQSRPPPMSVHPTAAATLVGH